MILVFGGRGQLGRELTIRAKATGVALTALNHADADIADAAAYNAVDEAERDAAAAMRANAEGPAVLVDEI